jgi:predicted GNAT family acetyltransferase
MKEIQDMQIIHEVHATKGSYSYRQSDAHPPARLTYSRAGDALIIIDHTEVPPEYRGQSIGQALVMRAVDDARQHSIAIIPLCPFAAAQFRRHPEWHDVLSQTMNIKSRP